MIALDDLTLPIESAFAQLTDPLPISPKMASITALNMDDMLKPIWFKAQGGTWVVNQQVLLDMIRMGLGKLPLSTVVLPQSHGAMLARSHGGVLIRDVSHHLSDYFPNFFVVAVYELTTIFHQHATQAFMIGGLIRDMLLSTERKLNLIDADITVEGNAVDAASWVKQASKNFDTLDWYPQFGTAKMNYKGKLTFDLASTRCETYDACGALPKVTELGVPLEWDIIRRDFTINSLALSITEPGKVLDYTGGLTDLENRELRLLKPTSFIEDPSRAIRAIKYAIRLDFNWSEDTRMVLEQSLPVITEVFKGGGERVRDEWQESLMLPESPQKRHWLNQFFEQGWYRLIYRSLPMGIRPFMALDEFTERLNEVLEQLMLPTELIVWQLYNALFILSCPKEHRQKLCERLSMKRNEVEVVQACERLLEDNYFNRLHPNDDVVTIYSLCKSLPLEAACFGALLSTQCDEAVTVIRLYINKLAKVTLNVNGDDIVHLGVPPGEQVGQLLKGLLHAKLQGQVQDRAEELAWLKAHVKSYLVP